MKFALATTLASLGLLAAGCTQTGATERGAATGALLGGAAGAIIGNNVGEGDAGSGAAIGAAVGAAGGAIQGQQQDRTQAARSGQYQTGPNGEALIWDRQYNRYYYVDRRSGRTYWANGDYRG